MYCKVFVFFSFLTACCKRNFPASRKSTPLALQELRALVCDMESRTSRNIFCGMDVYGTGAKICWFSCTYMVLQETLARLFAFWQQLVSLNVMVAQNRLNALDAAMHALGHWILQACAFVGDLWTKSIVQCIGWLDEGWNLEHETTSKECAEWTHIRA